jgi:hypothetical protein
VICDANECLEVDCNKLSAIFYFCLWEEFMQVHQEIEDAGNGDFIAAVFSGM